MSNNTKFTEKMNTALKESIQKFLIDNDDGPNLIGENYLGSTQRAALNQKGRLQMHGVGKT